MITNTDIRKIGTAVIEALKNRKGFDWWFDDLDSRLKSEIKMMVGRAAVKAVKEHSK